MLPAPRHPAGQHRRGDADRPEERPERNLHAGRQRRRPSARVEANQLQIGIRELARQRAAAGQEPDHTIRVEKRDVPDPHLQRIARLGAGDSDRPGERMRAGTAGLHRRLHCLQRLGNLVLGGAGQPQPLEPAGDHRLHVHAGARLDRQDRLERGVVVAPVHVVRSQRQIVRLLRVQHERCRHGDRDDHRGCGGICTGSDHWRSIAARPA